MSSPLYRRPAPRPPEDAQADVLRSKVARLVGEVRSLPERQAAIVLGMRDALAALKKVPAEYYTRAWFQNREREIKAQAKVALDRAEEAAAERLEEIRQLCEAATKPAPGSTQEQILSQLQVQNAWLAMRPHFDAVRDQADGIAAIEKACERAGDEAAKLQAIKQFAPDHLEALFAHLPGRDRARMQEVLAASVTAVESRTWTPVQVAGHELLTDVERGMGRLQLSSNQARREIEGYSGETAAALASWDGEAIYLTDRGQPLPSEVVRVAFGPEARAWEIAAAKNYPLLTARGAVADAMPSEPGQPRSAADVIRSLGGSVAPAGSEPPAY